MKRNSLGIIGLGLVASGIVAAVLMFSGCMTSKVVTPGGTNAVTGAVFQPVTNTIVNEANLALDCGVIQTVTAGTIAFVTQKEPTAVPALKDAELGLDGVLNGNNTNTTSKVLGLLQASDNPVLAAQVTSLLNSMSTYEQQLLAKYGADVGGEISLAISRAVYNGFVIGLAGQ